MNGTDLAEPLWYPDAERVADAELTRFMEWLGERDLVHASSYGELWRWSVEQRGAFWASIWDYFDAQPARRGPVPDAPTTMPGAAWFSGEHISYPRTALRHADSSVALIVRDESGSRTQTTYGELREAVAAASESMRRAGVKPGDRVAAVLPNREETVVAFLAASAIGAIWTLCSPEFGEDSIVARFAQTEPTILLTVDAYRYGGRVFDVRQKLERVASRLPTVARRVEVRSGLVASGTEAPMSWQTFVEGHSGAVEQYVDVDFDHPLWILFSSGTTGVPKAMLQGHGGIVLEHLKSLALHNDLKPGDVLFWYTSTAWMMWNYVAGALLRGATAVIYDGAPDPDLLWGLGAEDGVTLFGASPGFYQQTLDRGLPAEPLPRLRTLGSTGSPLLPETHRRLSAHLPGVHVASVSGGTDVCSGFVGPVPVLPVQAGWMQCRMLGVDCVALDADGRAVEGEIGALAVRLPMPSMPLRLWGDDSGQRYYDSYFSEYPGVWSHGDWIKFAPDGASVITGRSDATLNRGGVRMGTSEFYQVLESLDWVHDSLVVDTSNADVPNGQLVLFVVTEGDLDEERRSELTSAIRRSISPRHVPDVIVPVPAIPYTLTGKKCEIPVKRMLLGSHPRDVADPQSLRDPASLEAVVHMARRVLKESP